MDSWSALGASLVSFGAQTTARGNYIAQVGDVRVLVYRTHFDRTDYLGFIVAIAPMAACDPARVLTLSSSLASAPLVVNETVSLRYLLPREALELDLVRRTIATIAHDGAVFTAALGVPSDPSSLDGLSHYID
jgi:hypothetical protein